MAMIPVIKIEFYDGSKFLVRTDKNDNYQQKIDALVEGKKKGYVGNYSVLPLGKMFVITQTTIEEKLYLGINKKEVKDKKVKQKG